ncbi:MAG: hypothetical protein EOO24_50760, partial [Comamonadaceae bacterium]
MKRDTRSGGSYRYAGFLLVAALLVLWELSARLWVGSQNWPPISQIAVAGVGGIANGELPKVFLSSLGRMLAGFTIGAVLGVVIGLCMGRFRLVNAALD